MSIIGEMVELNWKDVPVIASEICGYKKDPYVEKNKITDPVTNTVWEESIDTPVVVDREDIGIIRNRKGKYVLVDWIKSGSLWTFYKHIALM